MRIPRLLVAAATIAAVAALPGCLLMPTTAPIATPAAPAVPTSSEEVPESVPGDPSTNTVDDDAGDTWTYALVDVESPTTLAVGTPPPGMQALALVLDATHDEGYASWSTCFDVYVVTDEGSWSSLDDASDGLEAVDDRSTSIASFTQGRVVVAVPEGFDASDATIVIASAFGDDARSFAP